MDKKLLMELVGIIEEQAAWGSCKKTKLADSLTETTHQDVTFTKPELLRIFKHFLDRLVDMGNTREEMVKYHIDKLVGLPYRQVVQKMPRGPTGHWVDLMMDIKDELRDLAVEKEADIK